MGLLRWLKRYTNGASSTDRPPVARGPEVISDDTISALFRDAVSRHSQGDLEGAEGIYRAILEEDRDFVPALHLLGRVRAQGKNPGEARSLLERALALSPDDVDILTDLANLCRLAGGSEEAKRLLERAISLEPGLAKLHYALAALHLERGEVEAAIYRLEHTVALDQAHADALNDLGAAYLETGRYDEARHVLNEAVRAGPSSPAAFRNLANLCSRMGDSKQSAKYYRLALRQSPQDQDLRMRLADALLLSGAPADAIKEYLAVAERNPGDPLAWKRLAETAAKIGESADAIAWYRRSLDADPRQPEVLNNLGILLSDDGQYEQAAESFEQAVRIQPDFDRGFDNLGGVLHLQNRHDEAVDAYKKALDIDPLNAVTLSNFIAITNYRRQVGDGLVERLHGCYLRSIAPERVRATVNQGKDRAAGRRLRVGYVSPDFRRHSVAFFIEPLIEGHDRDRFEVYCYSDVANPDPVTDRLLNLSDYWRDVSSDSDEAVAERIREDQIDLLVDLDGHFAGNRLPVFAQKPARVQLSYLGYPATTGLPELDYRLTDRFADPPDDSGSEYSETLVYLPNVFLCYRPPDGAPRVTPTKSDEKVLTFGSFNELPKLSPELIRCWGRILERVPGSRLLLKATALKDPSTRSRVARQLEAAGVSPDRIELSGRTATLAEHLALYARVDVALDTFPYNGTTTTCEALYMGVPVVALAGQAHAGRVGASLLNVLNLSDLVALSADDYVAKAVSLAADREQRGIYRRTLRDRLLTSPLCDERTFVRELEEKYLDCWKRCLGADQQDHRHRSLPLEKIGVIDIETRDGGRMVLPEDIDQLTTYVLLEQEDWFEEEIAFLRDFLSPGMRVLDIGANFGAYTVLAARSIGASGRVFSVEPSSTTAKWLRANVAVNGFENVEVFENALGDQSGDYRLSVKGGAECHRLVAENAPFERGELVKVLRLDDFAHRCGIERVDFVKLDAEGAEKQIIDGGRQFFARESPLVMFEIKSTEEPDLALVRKFTGLGYRPLRLIPGLGLLSPVDLSQPLDSYALNLLACKDDRLKILLQEGLVAEEGSERPSCGEISDDAIWNYLRSKPYAHSHVDAWKSRIGSADGGTRRQWMQVLGYYASAADTESSPSDRLANLKAAFRTVTGIGNEIEPAAHLNSLARIAWALGIRSQAVDALTTLRELGEKAKLAFNWPFLPASPRFDAIDPAERLAAWCEACAIDQFECLRSFSSYFLGRENLGALEQLMSNPFQRAEMERRRLLVRLRHGLPVSDASKALRERSEENRNPDFWRRRLERE